VSTHPTIVETPGGPARVVYQGWQYGLHIVRVKHLDTGSTRTYERRNVVFPEVR
jgi:hypothetical protein